jgi:hypothetical protein
VPFTVAVDHAQDPCGPGWLVLKAPGEFPDPVLGPAEDWTNWVRETGAIPAKTGNILLTLQGRSAAQVVITGMKARVTERRPAPEGTHVYQTCGDIGAFRWVSVRLDADPPRLTTDYDPSIAEIVEAPPQEMRPIRFPYRISISDAETFSIFGQAERCDCAWHLELTWSSEGRTGTHVVDVDGRPFRTAGLSNIVATCVKTREAPLRCEPDGS